VATNIIINTYSFKYLMSHVTCLNNLISYVIQKDKIIYKLSHNRLDKISPNWF